ncbi:MAG TPA: hypothetical protein DCY07_04740 [Rhodospirillaceae bacterium]|nr:hypothetical protein [Rhodospirillaceae bacterium]
MFKGRFEALLKGFADIIGTTHRQRSQSKLTSVLTDLWPERKSISMVSVGRKGGRGQSPLAINL